MIELRYQTPLAWAESVAERPLELLADHAHCELRAAASAQGLIHRRPGQRRLVERLSALAIEELEHFREVHRLLLSLGGELRTPEPSPYAEGLLRGRGELLDRLLAAALIEARSLERFELLAGVLEGPLGELYGRLAPSERGHALLFPRLAEELFDPAQVADRLDLWLDREAEVARSVPHGPRIHAGPPGGG